MPFLKFLKNIRTNKTKLWTDGWTADQGPTGNVFGFFYSTWGINFTLMNNSLETAVADGGKAEVGNGIYGDYAVCKGPQEFYWGGTWLCAANGTDNIDEVKDIMEFFCCEKDPMKQISMDQVEFYNNKEAMEEIADSDYGSDFLSGQNPYKDFCKSAENISITTSTIYDQGLTEAIQNAMTDYFNRIIVPILKPAIAVQVIFSFVGSWNNYLLPSLILKKDEIKTLPILIAQLRSADFLKFDMGQVYMLIFIAIIPVCIVYIALSRFIVGGLAVGSVKG